MFGYPIYDTVRMAFSYVNATNFVTGHWRWAGFENFRTLPYVEGWNLTLRNTGLFIAGSVIPQFVIGGLLAVALRENSRPRRWARSLVLLPWLFPIVATATTFLWMTSPPSGLFDSILKSLRGQGAVLARHPQRCSHRRHRGEHLDRGAVLLLGHPERFADHFTRSSRSRVGRWLQLVERTDPDHNSSTARDDPDRTDARYSRHA